MRATHTLFGYPIYGIVKDGVEVRIKPFRFLFPIPVLAYSRSFGSDFPV